MKKLCVLLLILRLPLVAYPKVSFFFSPTKKTKTRFFHKSIYVITIFCWYGKNPKSESPSPPLSSFTPYTKLNRKTNIEETDIEQSRKYYNFEVPLLIYSSTDLRHIVTVPRRICKLNMHGLLSSKMIAVTPANITVSFSSRDKAFLLDFRQNTGKRNTQKYWTKNLFNRALSFAQRNNMPSHSEKEISGIHFEYYFEHLR